MKFRDKYWFLSNFYPHRVVCFGLAFECAEAAFQACKAVTQGERQVFLGLNGAEAKKQGRRLTLHPDWNEQRLYWMEQVLRRKFSDPALADRLLDTGDEELVEDNDHGDTFWGRSGGRGQNHLGLLLMKLRQELREKGTLV